MFGSLGVRGERLQGLFGGRLEAPRTKNRLHIPSATTSSTLAHFHLQSCLLPLGTRASREIIVRDNGELLTFCCRRRLREVHVHASESGDKAEDKAKEFTYNPEKGQELSKIGGGTLFVIVAIYAFARLLARRSTYFTKVRLASRNEDEELMDRITQKALDSKRESGGDATGQEKEDMVEKGPKDVFTNAATVGAIFVLLYIISTNIESYVSSITLPEQYTVRQVSVTLKTIVIGMSYLATFIYGANALGLFLLGIDMIRNPEKHKSESEGEYSSDANDGN